jgi:hypothetical protein
MWKCSNCGEQVEDDFETCWNCGFDKDGTASIPSQNFNLEEGNITSFDPLVRPLSTSVSEIPTSTRGEKIQVPADRVKPKQFNWGAFALTPIWLLFHKRIGTVLILILLTLVLIAATFRSEPGVVMLKFYSIMIYIIRLYFGYVGDEIAWETKRYSSFEQLKEKQKGWILAGKIVFFFVEIPLSIYGVYIWLSK